jgi:hypothetical protein
MYDGNISSSSSTSSARSPTGECVWPDATHAASTCSAASIITCGDIVSAERADHAANAGLRDFLDLLFGIAHLHGSLQRLYFFAVFLLQ